MTLALLGFLAFAAASESTPAPTQSAYIYRTPDGIDHYVGSEDDIPEAYRKVSRRIELTGVPLNTDIAKGWNHEITHEPPPPAIGKPTDITARAPPPRSKKEPESDLPGPTTYALFAAILLCLFPALLIGWLRAPRKRVPVLALAIADLALGLGVGLYATHELRPANANDLIDLNPLHAWDNARKMRDQVNATEAAREKQVQEMDAAKSPAKPGPQAPKAKPSTPAPIKQP